MDVVLSRQRRYQERVLPLLAKWETDSGAHWLRGLASHEPDQKRYDLRSNEAAIVVVLARNLSPLSTGAPWAKTKTKSACNGPGGWRAWNTRQGRTL